MNISSGRPPIYGESMKQTGVYLRGDQIEWLRKRPKTISETIRNAIDALVGNIEAGNSRQPIAEINLETYFCSGLVKFQRQKRTRYGVIDVLTDTHIYEIKTELRHDSFLKAVGQLTLYALDYPDHKKAIVYSYENGNHGYTEAAQELGIELLKIEQK